MKASVKWLDRRIAAPGPYLALCLDERDYLDAMRHLNVRNVGEWISTPQSDATAHYLDSWKGLAVVVCMRGWRGRDPIEVAGLLIHEAVHVWQEYAERLGEVSPGREQEAYAIQSIAQELMAEFVRQTSPRGSGK